MKGKVLENYFNTENLRLAFQRVVRWPDRMAKDRLGIRAFEDNINYNLDKLSQLLLSEKYIPQRGFKYFEPKSTGTQRTKTILMIEDALVYQAIANVLAEKNYIILSEHENFVFGSVLSEETRIGTNLLETENANFFFFKYWKSLYLKFKNSIIKAIDDDKVTHKFETDITGFFDSIPHYNLLLTLSTQFSVEDEILDILSVCLNNWSGTKESITPGVGIPQGPLPSYLLANLLLHSLDKQLISEAFKYYRYMDDIKIYGYSENELRSVLVLIDNYLKGIGLSINSKKTAITYIEKEKKVLTIKDLIRSYLILQNYSNESKDDQIQSENDFEKEHAIYDLITQSPGEALSIEDSKINIDVINDIDQIKQFWNNEILEVERELPLLFNNDTTVLIDPLKSDDIEFIRFSSKYGNALRALSEYTQIQPSLKLLPCWIFALKNYYWRANNYLITLQFYKGNPNLKNTLLELFYSEKNYEWFRYHLIVFLTYNFNFHDKELRALFQLLKAEKSDLVRYSLYCLMIKHSNDSQLLSTLKKQLQNEQSTYIKLIVLDFWKKDSKRINTMDELINSVGL